ncbi:hypothetical protein FEP07_05752 [Burkholderia multivorans]|nr:hypothetical protein [Burkholderia multivorans]MDR9271026.1 hypothetical protein [Burkholderia multivorans]MDR9285700.1 hypothetical protein [Burkholderia multivorans]MDR9294189.1 hypothetical protein [Burkholderia multivorans]MDR9317067.1 hypothetical protein [Burkholderia multivorans]
MRALAQRSRWRKAPIARCIGRRCAQQRRAIVDVDRAARLGRTAQGRRRVIRATTRNDCARDGTNIVGHTSNNGCRRRGNIASHRHRSRRARIARGIACRDADLRAERQRRRRRVRPRAARIGRYRRIRRAVAVRVDLDCCARFGGAGQRGAVRRVHGRRSRRRRIYRQIECCTRRAHVARCVGRRHRNRVCAFTETRRRRERPVPRRIGRCRAEQRRTVEYVDRAACFRRTAQGRRRIVRATTGNECARDRANVISHTGNDGRRRRRNIARHRHRSRRARIARRIACRYSDLGADRQRRRRRVRPCSGRIGRHRCVRCAVAIRVDLNRRACFGGARQRRAIRRIHRRRRRSSRIHRQFECRARHAHVPRRIRCRDRQAMCTFAQCSRRRKCPVAGCVGRCRAEQRRTVEYVDRAARFGRTAQRRRRIVGGAIGNDCARD